MINTLLELGLTEQQLTNIKEFINDIYQEDLKKNIPLLKSVGCDIDSIKNIIIGNPLFLQRNYSDIQKLIDYLQELGLTYLNLLFDSYPMFLNKDSFEIKNYIEDRINLGEELEDIVDDIDSNPIIIDEV